MTTEELEAENARLKADHTHTLVGIWSALACLLSGLIGALMMGGIAAGTAHPLGMLVGIGMIVALSTLPGGAMRSKK